MLPKVTQLPRAWDRKPRHLTPQAVSLALWLNGSPTLLPAVAVRAHKVRNSAVTGGHLLRAPVSYAFKVRPRKKIVQPGCTSTTTLGLPGLLLLHLGRARILISALLRETWVHPRCMLGIGHKSPSARDRLRLLHLDRRLQRDSTAITRQ